MGAPPGITAPGMSPPPGMPASAGSIAFQPPNLPNINFNAPVIRLGVPNMSAKPATPLGGFDDRRSSNAEPLGRDRERGSRLGLGMQDGRDMGRERERMREAMLNLQPSTREEIARTIFIGGLVEGLPADDALERVFRSVGGLRRWTRVYDTDGKACKFGFAEFEDAASLEVAAEILKNVEVPLKKATNGIKQEEGTEERAGVEKARLLVVVDEASKRYIEEWSGRRKDDENAQQFRVDTAREDLNHALASLASLVSNGTKNGAGADGDTAMTDGDAKLVANNDAEVITIPLTGAAIDDELSEIPVEMRATVAAEIASFRDRSVKRDLERLRKEEELEAAERRRGTGARVNRLVSPPTGPAGGANSIPVGPRGGIPGAPSGPKGFRGAQIPKDYADGVAFVSGPNGMNDEDGDSASDEELERRRWEKRNSELEKLYLDQERRWLNRERVRSAALQREKVKDEGEEHKRLAQREDDGKRLQAWDDDEEAKMKVEEYYANHSLWIRNRDTYRKDEERADALDREAEQREKAHENVGREQAKGLADSFLEKMGGEMEERSKAQEPVRFKMNLGAAAPSRPTEASSQSARAKEVENLLEDEEPDSTSLPFKRTLNLRPLPALDPVSRNAHLTDEERAEAKRQLAAEIPSSKEDLWEYPIAWSYVTSETITKQIRPFVERKIVEALGVQEDLLVNVVQGVLDRKGSARELAEELENTQALDEETEPLVKKIWRMLIFFSESGKKGLTD
ncbi:hypothetical protein LTR66_004466 [Elasticomyces elasticus]|nr:hypothetical protein LTR50_000916 [Elasticomyces elasticus]KAK4995782.1 hypothetical protein LTR66_004466 [Elasticomyces elasticus]